MSLELTGIEEQTRTAVENSLRVFPNPAVAGTTVSYRLPRSAPVSCVVYDAAGNLVSRLAAGTQAAGEHRLVWNPAGVKPGVYYCKLSADGAYATTRLTLAR